MPRLVISTVGTSILTNQLKLQSESDWSSLLDETANDKDIDNKEDVLEAIEELTRRAKEKLYTDPEQKLINDDIDEIRSASAELNGIYGLYKNQLDNSKLDYHYLITTDTAQGQVTATVVRDFLQRTVGFADIYTPEKLSTASTECFTNGIDDLLDWLDKKVNEFSGFEIHFNLVGGFKALQGYMNTIGMFYANKIIYIFEGTNSNLITIPRLPITIDKSKLEEHIVTLALLNAGAALTSEQTSKLPEAMVAEIDGKMTISNWGQLIWNRCKDEFLSQKLQDFPRITYEDSFKADYKNISTPKEKSKLQETLAKVSFRLEESNGNTRALSKVVSYYEYQGQKDKEGVDHFYIGIHWRVSCKVSNGELILRHYGTHNYVERKELKNKK